MASSAHSPQKIKLCEHVLLHHFGPIAARVGTLLLKRGRLSVRDLQRFLNQAPTRTNRGPGDTLSSQGTSMGKTTMNSAPIAGASSSYNGGDPNAPVPIPRLLIQQTIMTLVQHGCAWHSSADTDSSEEFFEINIQEVLARLRFGRYIGIAEDELGDVAAKIVRQVLKHGKMQAQDILDMMTTDTPLSVNGDLTNGKRTAEESHETNFARVEASRKLTQLLYHTYLRPSTVQQHISPRDKQIHYELKRRRDLKGIPTPKELRQIKDDVHIRIAEERDADWDASGSGSTSLFSKSDSSSEQARRGLIRRQQSAAAMANAAYKGKKTKLSHSKRSKDKSSNGDRATLSPALGTDSDPSEEFDIDPTVWLRVHYDRFDVHIRDEIMIDAVKEKYNSTAAQVFRQLINAGDASVKKTVRDTQSAPISIAVLAHKIPSDLSLPKGFDRRSFAKDKASIPSKQEFLAEYCAIFAHSEDVTGKSKTTRFLAPASDSTTKTAGGSKVASSFTIEFSNVAEQIRRDLLKNVVEEKFGVAAIRIMNILREKGKLEEKHISKLALVSISETRDLCSRLFHASLLGLQEVPKTKDRDPAKTFFLWFVDEAKCRAWLLDHLYQSLARLGQRRNEEMRRQLTLLRKVERTDVKLDTAGLLTEWERRSWDRLQNVLQTLTVAEMRTEMDVFVLRDLAAGIFGGDNL